MTGGTYMNGQRKLSSHSRIFASSNFMGLMTSLLITSGCQMIVPRQELEGVGFGAAVELTSDSDGGMLSFPTARFLFRNGLGRVLNLT